MAAEELPFPTSVQEIDARIVLSASGTISGKPIGTVRLKVLTFQETPEQKIVSLSQVLEINGKTIEAKAEADSYGNKYAVFEVNETGEFTYTIEAEIHKRVMPKYMLDFDLSDEIEDYGQYKSATAKIESNKSAIRTLALNRFDSNSWLETVAGIAHWTHNYVTYDVGYFPETYSAIETLENRRGTCDEFATLSAALLRAKGIPTRVVVGPVFSAAEWNFHGWADAYNPNSGWIAIDSTYGEAGIVDATHIKMGHFPDFIDAADISIAPAGMDVQLSQNKLVEVEIIGYEQFSKVISLEAENTELYAKTWQDLNIIIKNMVNSHLIAPIGIALPLGFKVEERDKVVLLKPLESREISWQVMVNKELQKNQYLEGTYAIVSLHPAIERTVRVLPSKLLESAAQIEVLDLYATIEGNALKINISLENKGMEAAEVEIILESKDKETERISETIGGLTKREIAISVENYSKKPYTVLVKGDGTSYSAEIIPEKEIVVSGNGEKKVEDTAVEHAGSQIQAGEILNVQTLVLVAIIFSIIAIMFLLKDLVLK